MLALLLMSAHTQGPVQRQPISADERLFFASRVFIETVAKRLKADADLAGLNLEVAGPKSQVLIIHDDSEEAKGWFDRLSNNSDTRNQLLSLGFTIVILANKKHGTFVFDLIRWGQAQTHNPVA